MIALRQKVSLLEFVGMEVNQTQNRFQVAIVHLEFPRKDAIQ